MELARALATRRRVVELVHGGEAFGISQQCVEPEPHTLPAPWANADVNEPDRD